MNIFDLLSEEELAEIYEPPPKLVGRIASPEEVADLMGEAKFGDDIEEVLMDVDELFLLYRKITEEKKEQEEAFAIEKQRLALISFKQEEIERRIDRVLKSNGWEKGTHIGVYYTFRASTSTQILDEGIVPKEFWSTKEFVDTAKIKAHFKTSPNAEIPGVNLEKKRNLNLKIVD